MEDLILKLKIKIINVDNIYYELINSSYFGSILVFILF
jgi:hypothetical protein